MDQTIIDAIAQGKTALGVEFGSTRIKAVLIDERHQPLASGSHGWENHLENGMWTYPLDEVWAGFQHAYAELKKEVAERYGLPLTRLGAIGVSAMMHGYLPFDGQGNLLAPFRTWRNTCTGEAAQKLTELLQFNIPQRWSIAHLYQAVLNGEEHVKRLGFLTTLAGYVHWQLTGEKVLGMGDASGVLPLDAETGLYDERMLDQLEALLKPYGFDWTLRQVLPKALCAGEDAGRLTKEGALLLDPTGELEEGALLCPPEGDAGTGMTATHSVAPRTGNVSAGTSVFAMLVLEKALSAVHPEIDMVTTPTGKPVAMVHCNSCTSDINAWAELFGEFAAAIGHPIEPGELFPLLYNQAAQGAPDGGGLVSFNYFSGEPITGLEEGRPLLTRLPDSRLTLANLMRSNLYAALGTLKLGMDILTRQEQVAIDGIVGHGGWFKTPVVGQRMMAAALGTPVSVMETAGEGGAWGVALLAMFRMARQSEETLEHYLDSKVFAEMKVQTLAPDETDVAGFDAYMKRYTACLPVERAAVDALR